MSSHRVLVIGSGGSSKRGYIKALLNHGAEVLVIEPAGKGWSSSSVSLAPTLEVDFSREDELLFLCNQLQSRYHFTAVDTVFELCVETAAKVRELFSLSGLRVDQVLVGRSKTKMLDFMDKYSLRHALTTRLSDPILNSEHIRNFTSLHGTSVLRPDRAGGKIGVCVLDSSFDEKILSLAKDSTLNNPYRKVVSYNMGCEWLLSKYVHGLEIETELFGREGHLEDLFLLMKTVSIERPEAIEENRYVTPCPEIGSAMLADLYSEAKKLCDALYREIYFPAGKKTYVVHPEYRVDENGCAFLLEFALRNGGGLNPRQIEYAFGVDVYEYSAFCTLDLNFQYQGRTCDRSAGYQMVFSPVKGIYGGFQVEKVLDGVTRENGLKVGEEITTPPVQALEYFSTVGVVPEEVDERLDEQLENAQVIVDGVKYPVPTKTRSKYGF
jgi:hypothetical protein